MCDSSATPAGTPELLTRLGEAEDTVDAYSKALHEIVNAHQRALGLAQLALLNGKEIDPEEMISCLTGRDAPLDAATRRNPEP